MTRIYRVYERHPCPIPAGGRRAYLGIVAADDEMEALTVSRHVWGQRDFDFAQVDELRGAAFTEFAKRETKGASP